MSGRSQGRVLTAVLECRLRGTPQRRLLRKLTTANAQKEGRGRQMPGNGSHAEAGLQLRPRLINIQLFELSWATAYNDDRVGRA